MLCSTLQGSVTAEMTLEITDSQSVTLTTRRAVNWVNVSFCKTTSVTDKTLFHFTQFQNSLRLLCCLEIKIQMF